jgi:hypothetical protein
MRRTYTKDLRAAVHVRLTAAHEAMLSAAAEREGVTKPEVVRAAVAAWLTAQRPCTTARNEAPR